MRRRWTGLLAPVVAVACAFGAVGFPSDQVALGTSPAVPPLPAATLAAVRAGIDPASAVAAPSGPVRFPTTDSDLTWRSRQVTVAYRGRHRQYLLIRPAAVTHRVLPMVVELAGAYVTDTREAQRADFAAITGPAVLVYPQDLGPGRRKNWDAGACCGTAAATHLDDAGFIAAVVRRVHATVPHERHAPVYLAGYSNGGKMALRMVCVDPGLFRAVAVYGAVESLVCDGNRPPPMSVLEMVGTADGWTALGPDATPVVQGGFREPSVVEEVGFYVRADRCGPAVTEGRAGPVAEVRWVDCAGGRRAGVAVWNDQDHGWPQEGGRRPSAQQVAWDFFRALGA